MKKNPENNVSELLDFKISFQAPLAARAFDTHSICLVYGKRLVTALTWKVKLEERLPSQVEQF